MIYTVTFNPSIDYIVRLEDLTVGEINRVNYEQILPGGKGINVSIVLKNLGHDSTALGFLAGFTGVAMQQMLHAFGVKDDFVRLDDGFSRINVKIKAGSDPSSPRRRSTPCLTGSTACKAATRLSSRDRFRTRCPTTSTSASWNTSRGAASASWSTRRKTCCDAC